MKKIIYSLLFVLIPSVIHAWIVNPGAKINKVSVYAEDMSRPYNFNLDYSGDNYECTGLWTSNTGIRVTKGVNDVYLFKKIQTSNGSNAKVSGFFVGIALDHGVSVNYGINIGTSNDMHLITKITISFVTINKDAKATPITKEYLARTTYNTYESGNDIRGTVTIEPYLPVSMIPVTCGFGNLDYTNVISKALNKTTCGCLVTNITVEYADKTGEGRSFGSLSENLSSLRKNTNHMFWRATLQWRRNNLLSKHCTKAVAGDINADGSVNSADIAGIYNTILSGDDEIERIRYVDLDLPSGNLWATKNYGATVPEDFGDFYVYNSTQGFLSTNIARFGSTAKNLIGWWRAPTPWRTPSRVDAIELLNHCTATKTYINDVYCIVLTSKTNGNQLILPATAGDVDENGYHDDAYCAQYWTNTARMGDDEMYNTIKIYPYNSSYTIDTYNSMPVHNGCYLRLVCPKQK